MPNDGNDNPKVFDVSKPHKITPSSSSRPIIIGHHPIMADPMVLEERYRHPKPLNTQPVEQPAAQTPVPVAPGSTSQRTSISPPSESQIPTEPSAEKAYTTYGASEQQISQTVEKSPPEPSQTPSVVPILDGDVSDGMNQKSDTSLPVMPQQPIPTSPLHVPAGAASQEHARNQIGIAVILLIVIALLALLAVKYLLK